MSETVVKWILEIGKYVAMGAAFWILSTLRNAFMAGLNYQKFMSRFEKAEREIRELKSRMDKAGIETSNLATQVNGLPERLRKDFTPRTELDLIISESKVDRQRLHDEIDNIWKVVNRREERRR